MISLKPQNQKLVSEIKTEEEVPRLGVTGGTYVW